ncbi:hypothetical protein SGFS_006310 [Streptomyces graminofaciens]|uniref:Uncharacterized protein n=1 Tax=Streptomyces graminofaciens TaxID=68212 RepID=A0ABN5V7Q9_9ACTN|nr:hypothetical protein [Streptomyces graminofaciens]BBC29337.1 hypothetical protein SGFS_006310 [Streptomyces graminofaciens]
MPFETRFLEPKDVEALLALERTKWDRHQAATGADLEARIRMYPQLSIGVFDSSSGVALASLFMKPISGDRVCSAADWADCARVEELSEDTVHSLFGISLTSVDADSVTAIFEFFWPYALNQGWRDIYLGSPMPGFRAWKQANPSSTAEVYMRERRHGLPRDPQLRYYYNKGFKEIVACKPGYFPHPASLDYGAVIRGRVPLSGGALLWRHVPLPWLQRLRHLLFRLVRTSRASS